MSAEINEKKIMMPFMEGLSFPMSKILAHFKDFVFLAGGLSLLTTIVALCLGRSLFCGFEYYSALKGLFCSNSIINLSLSSIMLLFCLSYFINRWQAIVFDKKTFLEAIKLKCIKKDVKAALCVFLYVAFWLILCITCVVLQSRKAVTDWHVEISFFVGYSMIIILVLFLLLNFVVFYNFLQGGHFFALNKTFWPVFDSIYKFIALFFIYFILFVCLFKLLFSAFMFENSLPLSVNVFACDFFYYFLIYLLTAIVQLSLAYQAKYLFNSEE